MTAQLIAESEARAVRELQKQIDWLQLNNDMLTDNPEGHARALKERADLIAERDQLRAQVALDEKAKALMLKEHFRDVDEMTKLRAEVDRLKEQLSKAVWDTNVNNAHVRAETAEAELVKERARFSDVRELVSGMRQSLDKHGPNCRFEGVGQISESFVEELETAIDEAMKEDGK
jgi:hypothetical protein